MALFLTTLLKLLAARWHPSRIPPIAFVTAAPSGKAPADDKNPRSRLSWKHVAVIRDRLLGSIVGVRRNVETNLPGFFPSPVHTKHPLNGPNGMWKFCTKP